MKFRQGFVLNSGTTRVDVYGTIIKAEDMEEILVKKNIVQKNSEGDRDIYDFLNDLTEKEKIVWDHQEEPEGEYYIGLKITEMEDNETLDQFKKRIGNKIEEIFGEKLYVELILST